MLAKTIKYFRSQCSPYQIISDIDLPFLDCNYRNTRNHLLSDYANKLLEDTSKGIHNKKNLISSVNAFKIEINSNPILKINF